jgi:hypothetical protein
MRCQRVPQKARKVDDRGMAMQMLDLVTVDRAVLHGQACIRGTRIPVSVVLDCIASGMTPRLRDNCSLSFECAAWHPIERNASVKLMLLYEALDATGATSP